MGLFDSSRCQGRKFYPHINLILDMIDNPIIDIHQHMFKAQFDVEGKPVRDRATGKRSTATTDRELIQQTLDHMDRNNIIKALAGGSPETIKSWVDTAPTRFIPSIELRGNPINPTPRRVKELLETDTIKAIGEILTQYHGIPPNDPKLDPYYALAEEYDVPAWIHICGSGALTPTYRVKYGIPVLVEDVLVKYPDLRLCVCHFGYPFMAEMASMLYMYPRLYADISARIWMSPREVFYGYLKGVLDYSGAYEQLMFGSDQMWWPEMISLAVDTLESASFLSKDQKRKIFYHNAKRFLKL